MSASDDLDSTWLFLKWASIDGVFLFGLQALHIPWLEWTFPTTLAAFLVHAVGNVFLMFRIPVCSPSFCLLWLVDILLTQELDSGGRLVIWDAQSGL